MSDLAKRAVACKAWRWMDGIHTQHCIVIEPMCNGRVTLFEKGRESVWTQSDVEDFGLLPDLSNPATIGCLLALVREAWGNPIFRVVPVFNNDGSLRQWMACNKRLQRICAGRTEADALVAALEAAPRKESTDGC